MSWSETRRRTLLALGGGLLAASCGFTPLHAPGGTGSALAGRIEVTVPTTLAGYRFGERVDARLGTAASPPAYRLTVALDIDRRSTAFTPAGEVTRYALTGIADWRLAAADGAEIASGRVDAFTGYSATGTTVATAAAAEDAEARLAVQLADLVVTRLFALDLP